MGRADHLSAIVKRDDIRGKYPDELDEQVAFYLGLAAGSEIFRKQAGCQDSCLVAVGYDARLSSPSLSGAIASGLQKAGATVYDLGLCSSEVLYFAAGHDKPFGNASKTLDGGVMVTASHNPADENGLKMVKRGAVLLGADELRLIAAETWRALKAREGQAWDLPAGARGTPLDVQDDYAEKVIALSQVEEVLANLRTKTGKALRVVVEAGHGVGGLAFRPIHDRLRGPLDVVYSHARPDGRFPCGLPNPLKPDYMRWLQDRVYDEQADVGLAFDGDADRVGVVSANAQWVSASEVLAILAERSLRSGATHVLYNLVCSRLVRDRIYDVMKGLGNADTASRDAAVMTPVGHGQIKRILPDYPGCAVAGEHSGHYFFREFFGTDSGMIAGLTMLAEVATRMTDPQAQSLDRQLAEWRQKYFACPETNFKVQGDAGEPLSAGQQRTKMQELVDKVHGCVLADAVQGHWGTGIALKVYAPQQSLRPQPEAAGIGNFAIAYSTDANYCPGHAIKKSEGVDIIKLELTQESCDWWFCVRPSGNEPLLRLSLEVVLKDPNSAGDRLLQERFDYLVNRIGRKYLTNN